ncbi:hypothetical protein F0L74_01235 [Chitinophaga agrisoli]|uniref:AsmA-like protein n=1 Tax=Chitinophaga agrisoli TaxID=2607653 RepID=A0A5B2W2B4_9BACT|nr:hypothetical protein [Chitinophaga agrisoli]KAA2244627.1 hypothetical protein F0L74_01235 [Chitinophaga agrisoli]
MRKPSSIQKVIKIALIVIGSFVLVVVGTGLYLSHRWSNTLRSQLKDYVKEMSDSLYELHYERVQLNILSGSLTLDSVSLVTDTVVYHRLQQQQRAPSLLYAFSADRVSLQYFKAWRYFLKKELSAGALVLESPSVVLERDSRNIDTSRHRPAYENLATRIKSLSIGTLTLDSTNLKYTLIKKDSGLVITQLHRLSIHVKDLLIDSMAMVDPTRFLYARNYELYLKDYRHRTKDSLYWMMVRDVSYSAAESTLRIGQFSVEPRYKPAEFDRKVQFQRDRYDIKLNDIVAKGLEPYALLQEQQLWAKHINIANGVFDIYHNRSLPSSPGTRLGQFPHQLLYKMSLPVYVDTLVGNKVDLSYKEVNPKSQQAGTLLFKQVHGVFRNITNIDSMIKKDRHLIADMDAVFMRSGKLRARFDFHLGDPQGGFAISGQLKNMDGRELTPITRPLALVEIKSANIQDVSFTMQGNERAASAEVKFIYDHLRVSILKKDDETHELKKKGLLSLFANAIAIKDSNPTDNGKLHIAHVNYPRDPKKSFFNLVWKTLFTGVKETAISGSVPL